MSILKQKDAKVENYVLQNLSRKVRDEDVSAFEFESLSPDTLRQAESINDVIRIERNAAYESGFEFSSEVKEHRGIKAQEVADFEKKVADAVSVKFQEVSEKAYTEGRDLGAAEGKKEALEQTLGELEQKVSDLQTMLEDLQNQRRDLLANSKENAYTIIKNLAKWVCLKEIKEDEPSYIKNLLERLIAEVNTKSSLSLKVSQSVYDDMPAIIKDLESKLGNLEGISFEVDPSLETGIYLESSNGFVDASFQAQMETIDKIFTKGA